MHPFWAVRRLTPQQLARAQANVKPGGLSPRFNRELVMHQLTTWMVRLSASTASGVWGHVR